MKWDPANDVPGGYQMGQKAMNTLFVEPRFLQKGLEQLRFSRKELVGLQPAAEFVFNLERQWIA